MTSAEPENPEIELLYQTRPRKSCKFPLKSKTASLQSYRLDALHEYGKLKVNGTIPNHIILLNYLIELPKKDIQALWRKHARRLKRAGIVARVAVEITRDEWKQRPVNRVHYHFVAKDDRTPDELQELFEALFGLEMPRSAFKVHHFSFDDQLGGWQGYIAYFVKLYGKDGENILFRKRGLRKYYTINEEKWWTYPDGTSRTIESIKEEMGRYASAKKRLKQSEQFIEVKHPSGGWEYPTDHIKLQVLLDKQTDETLYDWLSALQGKPALFRSRFPKWLRETIRSQPLKTEDLLDAIYIRLRETHNPLILFAFEIYHNHKIVQ